MSQKISTKKSRGYESSSPKREDFRIQTYLSRLDNLDEKYRPGIEHIARLAKNFEDEKLLTFLEEHIKNMS
jgi:hypothetical protein